MRVGTSITSCSRSYVGLQANNMDERTPDSKRIGECLILNFLKMKKSLEKKEMMKKGFIDISDSLDTVVGGRRAAGNSGCFNIICRKKPKEFHRGMFIPISRYRQLSSLRSYRYRQLSSLLSKA